jgi:hypothetical protein
MNKRSRQAALRIRLLVEEFSPQELNEALAFLGGQPEEDLLHFLNRIKSTTAGGQSSRRVPRGKGTKPSRALDAIRDTEPEKYQLLRTFEQHLWEGDRLRSLHDVRTFGQMLDKDFDTGKSRHEGIGRLMKKLAEMGLEDLREVIRRAPVSNVEESDGFLRLSRHIISGAKEPDSRAE